MEERRYNGLSKQIERQRKKHRKKIVMVLACMVVFCTTYALILPAITMSQETYCGKEEHVHDETCYSTELICGFEDGEVVNPHEHTEDCIQVEQSVSCGYEESEEHTHDESCYTENVSYICEVEDEIHEHTDACYQEVFRCELEEHTHTLSCYSDKTADLENASKWEATLPDELSGIWADDLLKIAESQLGYTESTKNYEVFEEDCMKGYTRYGEWYGVPYEDWCAMFVSFCLDYAEVPAEEFPQEADCEKWVEELKSIEKYAEAYTYSPKKGDLIFFDLDQDGNCEHVGIVKEVDDTTVKTIEGNSADAVAENTYNLTEESIVGYGILPEKEIASRTAAAVIYTDETYETTSDDLTQITVVGKIPEEAEIRAYPTTFETDSKIVCAYDITIFLPDGTVFEPEEGDHLTVTFKTADLEEEEEVGVYYIPEEGSPEEMDATIMDEEITFDAEHFSTYAVLAAPRVSKANTGFTIVTGADTSELVRINLYDYGSNINDNYNSNKNYPGFQQDNGTTTLNANSSLSLYAFNFGNNITEDLAAGKSGVTNSTGINATNTEHGAANAPISGAMYKTLKNGYPALADGTSLKYLFSTNEYATKKNTGNINGLFQYDEKTGSYNYDCRLNHAQFNASNNTFTLYNQLISSNFMMYPFGNFLPFNDITTQTQQASKIDRAYLQTIKASAEAKGKSGDANQTKLAEQLGYFISAMDKEKGNTTWTAYDAVNAYFKQAGISTTFTETSPTLTNGIPVLDDVYSIDYDEATDFYFGMDIETTFYQPKGGQTGKNYDQDMVFYFTGDDDVWVYIDDVLFLDLSGIHRHVGGKIDFVNGTIRYFALVPSVGDVVTGDYYKEVTFEQVIREAYDNDTAKLNAALAMLNDEGTFKDYSTHTFHMYYMERGAGSGVCRINFNFPLVKQNTIQVQKELSASETVLGNPDYAFQIVKAETENESFLAAGTPYTLYDADGTLLQKVTYTYNSDNTIASPTVTDGKGNSLSETEWWKTDSNGIFYLKAGQKAEFGGIESNKGTYFVQELFEDDTAMGQYGEITVSGETTTVQQNLSIGNEKFTGVKSPVKDTSASCTIFKFKNKVDNSKLGSLSIKKIVNGADPGEKEFQFVVTLDGKSLPQGTTYTVTKGDTNLETKTIVIDESGNSLVTIKAGQTATIGKILAGSEFNVSETSKSAEGYQVTYTGMPEKVVTIGENGASGRIQSNTTVAVEIKNQSEAISIKIPVTKSIENPDDTTHKYTFILTQVEDSTGEKIITSHLTNPINQTIEVGKDSKTFEFELIYEVSQEGTYYYKIEEENTDSTTRKNSTVYVIEVTVTKGDDFKAEVTGVWKDGNNLEENATISFVNTLVGELKIAKYLGEGSNNLSNQKFKFTILLTKGTAELSDSYPVEYSSDTKLTSLEFTDGKAEVTLKGGEFIIIKNLPIGTQWAVTEESGNWKAVSEVKIVGSENAGTSTPLESAKTSGSIQTSTTEVSYTNYSLYALPNSGGSGTHWYKIGGLLLVTMAALLLLYQSKKREKGEVDFFLIHHCGRS